MTVRQIMKKENRLRWQLFLMMLSISLVPLFLFSYISYDEYRVLLEKESENRLRWDAAGAKNSIETFIDELKALLVFVSHEYSIEELSDQKLMSRLFVNLKRHYEGLIDLGVIDSRGVQRVYVGPFRLKGVNYSGYDWFKRAKTRHVYISTVVLEPHKVPYFVITVTKTAHGRGDYRLLRVSVDAEVLEKFISTLNAQASYYDVFIIDQQGKFQTSSRFGAIGDTYPIPTATKINGIIVTEEKNIAPSGLQAMAYLENSPWILVLVTRGFVVERNWTKFRNELFIFLLLSASVVVIVIWFKVGLFVRRIHEAYEKRDVAIAEAEHAAKLASIGRLAAGVAHEINNPLAIIDQKAGLAQDLIELAEDFEYKEKIADQIRGIQEAVARCKVITHRLLGFARRMDVSLEEIDLNGLVAEVVNFLDKEALYRHINIELNLAEDLPRIYSDRGQLQQIFLNIINNAIDAIGDRGGRIVITSSLKDQNTVRVAIEDNGPGIPPHVLKHIFEPFFTTKEPGKGTGLGLSITYGLVKKLGGTISVKSEVGEGATFFVDLPIRREDVH